MAAYHQSLFPHAWPSRGGKAVVLADNQARILSIGKSRLIWILSSIRFDPFLVVSGLLGILLFVPLLQSGLPQAPDALLHFYRAAAWRWAWHDGVLWPRWHTLLYQGYGYPVLNFDAPLLYILTALVSYITSNLLTALKAVLLLIYLAYSMGMYLWTKVILGRFGAIVASTAYTFAAFRFRELYFLGTYPQFLAWALYPLVLFFFLQLARHPSRGYFLGAVLSMAAVITAHNISAMLFAPILGAYAVGLAIAYRKERAWMRVSGAAICAVLLAAAFWLPALGEMGYTKVKVLTQGHFDINLHFLRLAELVAVVSPLDARAVNPPLPFTLGRWHLVLAAAGVLTIFSHSRSRLTRYHLVGALCVVGGGVFMMLPYSSPLWRTIPLISFAEYPWRVYGVVFLGSSLLVGAAMTWFARTRALQWAATGVAISGLLLSVAVYQFPRPFLAIGTTPVDYLSYETTFRAIGTTSADEFLGRWVETPPRESTMRPDQGHIALVDAPDGVTAKVLDMKARSFQIAVQAQAPATLTLA